MNTETLNGIAEHIDGRAWLVRLHAYRPNLSSRIAVAVAGTTHRIGDVIRVACCGDLAVIANGRATAPVRATARVRNIDGTVRVPSVAIDRIVNDHDAFRIIDRATRAVAPHGAHYTEATACLVCDAHNGSAEKHDVIAEREAMALERLDRFAPRA